MEAPRRQPTKVAAEIRDRWLAEYSEMLGVVSTEFQLTLPALRIWGVLYAIGLLYREQTINAKALGAWGRVPKTHHVHEALVELREAGLLKLGARDRLLYSKCSLIDPRGVYGPRRQACYRQEHPTLPGASWEPEELTAQTAHAIDVVRIDDGAADAPPPSPHHEDFAPPGAPKTERAAPKTEPNPALCSAKTLNKAPKTEPISARQLSNLESRSIWKPPLETSNGESPYEDEFTSEVTKCAAARAENGADFGAGRDDFGAWRDGPLRDQTEKLHRAIPGLWPEIADWVIDEVAGLHEPTGNARGRFTADDLAKIISRTRGLYERQQLQKPPAVYFAGACQQRFRQLGLRWLEVKPAKPR